MKYFDLHCDTMTGLAVTGGSLDSDAAVSVDKVKAAGFDAYVQCFAAFISDEYRNQAATVRWDSIYDCFQKQMALYPEEIEQVKSFADLKRITATGKIAAILTTESGAAFGGKLEKIAEMKGKGCLITTLTWNDATELAGGVYTPDIGLTSFGKEALQEMERVGMIADVSHLCDKALDDMFLHAKKPFIATHSNSRSMCNAMRNLRDDQIQEMVKRKNLIGLNYGIYFLNDQNPKASTRKDMVRHIEYFLELGAEDVIAMGSDFDGTAIPKEFDSLDKVPSLYTYIAEAVGAEIADKLFFENAKNFFAQNLK